MLRRAGLERLRGIFGSGIRGVGASKVMEMQFEQSVADLSYSLSAAPASGSTPAEEEILVEERFGMKIAILNRPKKLNAVNATMCARLRQLYERWDKDQHVHIILLKVNPGHILISSPYGKGNGRGFCAGGDVAAVYNLRKAGQVFSATDFFRQEYQLNYIIGTLTKPHVALLNGVVMGGGTGLSIHGQFRVATENSVFSMPETAISLHPDVGASYYLSRLPGHLGEYLALTGTRLDGADMVACNLATHFVPSHRLNILEERLGGINTEDLVVVGAAIEEYCDIVHLNEKSPLHRSADIDSCFRQDTVEEIIHALEGAVGLESSTSAWFRETLATIKKHSPISLKVTLRSVREGRREHLHQCLKREFRLSVHMVEGRFSKDFMEGCRAVLVEKDKAPKWDPPYLEQVQADAVDYIFSPVSDELGGELHLPVEKREPHLLQRGYSKI